MAYQKGMKPDPIISPSGAKPSTKDDSLDRRRGTKKAFSPK